jgi:DNA-binding CsgD family transcriptional regulator
VSTVSENLDTQQCYGRTAELANVRGVLAAAVRGRAAVVCVDGKVGMGKTTLLRESSQLARAMGFTVLSAGTSSTDRPYGVVTQLFEQTTISPTADEHRVLPGLYRAVKKLAQHSPVFIAIDDVERADPQSLRWLEYLRPRLGGLPVVLALTRTGFANSHDVGNLVEGETRIRLTGLGQSACTELVGTVFPLASQGFIADCRQATAGNPYLLEELLRASRMVSLSPTPPEEIPEELGAEVLTLVDRDRPELIAMARAVAVLGTADFETAAAAADLDQHSAAWAVRTLAELGFCTANAPIAFTYPILRTTVANGVTSRERTHILLRAARHAAKDDSPASALNHLYRLLGEQLPAYVLDQLGEDHCHTEDPDVAQRLDLYALCLQLEQSHTSVAVERRISRLLTGPRMTADHQRFLDATLAFRDAMVGAGREETLARVQSVRLPSTRHQLTEGAWHNLVDQWSVFYQVSALMTVDELETAARCCDEVLEGTDFEAPMRGLKSQVSARQGALGEAADLGLTALKELDALDDAEDNHVVIAVAGLLGAWVDLGELNSASELLRRRGFDGDLPDFSHYHALLHQRGRLRTALGDHRAALRDHLECGRRLERHGVRNVAVHPWRSHAALAYLRLGETDAAFPLIETELELAGKWGSPTALGVALRAAALVIGDETGRSLLADSVVALQDSPAKLELACSLIEWGVSLEDTDRKAEARAALRQAHELAKQCGAAPLAGRAALALRVAGGRATENVSADPAVLTAQELKIAQLAASGLTNRRIGEELYVTARAVEFHLTSIYRKLGIPGRLHLEEVLAELSHGRGCGPASGRALDRTH